MGGGDAGQVHLPVRLTRDSQPHARPDLYPELPTRHLPPVAPRPRLPSRGTCLPWGLHQPPTLPQPPPPSCSLLLCSSLSHQDPWGPRARRRSSLPAREAMAFLGTAAPPLCLHGLPRLAPLVTLPPAPCPLLAEGPHAATPQGDPSPVRQTGVRGPPRRPCSDVPLLTFELLLGACDCQHQFHEYPAGAPGVRSSNDQRALVVQGGGSDGGSRHLVEPVKGAGRDQAAVARWKVSSSQHKPWCRRQVYQTGFNVHE